MDISFDGGRFVSLSGELNYTEVLNDFQNAKTIRIVTYNISKNQKYDALLDALKSTEADVQIITNVPSRMDHYYKSDAGQRMRSIAKSNIDIYLSKLNPDNFSGKFVPFFNVHNHAKIIGTENIVYIGSANFSNESANNIETGVLIEDKDFIQKLYDQFFNTIKKESLSYFDETFSAFQLSILSLYAKFTQHYRKIMTDLYTDFERTGFVVADTIFIDISDLNDLYQDLDELKFICYSADDIYDEENEEYNDALDQLKRNFERLSIEWLQEIISEDGSLYRLVAFDEDKIVNDILQTEYAFEAYDEGLDPCVSDAMSRAYELYSSLHNDFEEESEDFLKEIEKILSALNFAARFTNNWKANRINPEIDNT